jgi:hypothetical protein
MECNKGASGVVVSEPHDPTKKKHMTLGEGEDMYNNNKK